ncbi:neuroblastoma breakpoint family member 6-like [Erinaceus europaeus]|uniref:Neuroblastoma breakpoint family member 6-like n=1 Tax=Erinaceus europaeus TaxID=9365 RepID=A0ABM3YB91_ERIEU|nr:neuroblastoma breakpoint family member 6-like [Erinaceus europaeus]
MAKWFLPLYGPLEDKFLLEEDQELQTQMALCKRDFRVLNDRVLGTVATAGYLDHVLWSYEHQNDQEAVREQEPVAPRVQIIICKETIISFIPDLSAKEITDQEDKELEMITTRLVLLLPELADPHAPWLLPNGRCLTFASLPDVSDNYWPHRSSAFQAWEEEGISPAQPGAENHPDSEEHKNSSHLSLSNISRESLEGEEDEYSLDERYLTPSFDYDVSECCRPCSHDEQEGSTQDGAELDSEPFIGWKNPSKPEGDAFENLESSKAEGLVSHLPLASDAPQRRVLKVSTVAVAPGN